MENQAQKRQDFRALTFWRQSTIARWIGSGKGVCACLRCSTYNAEQIGILTIDQRSSVTHVQHCNGAWLCPVCALKIAYVKRDKMQNAIDHLTHEHMRIAFITYTLSHTINDPLATVRDHVQSSHRELHSGKGWQTIERKFNWQGSIKSVEITYGRNGWHFHLHEIAFVTDRTNITELESAMAERWRAIVAKRGSDALPGIGLKIGQAKAQATRYVGKWGIVPELSAAQAKKAHRGAVMPFQFPDLLASEFEREQWCRDRFIEYKDAVKGLKQIWASASVREFMITDKKTDADDKYRGGIEYLTLEQWREICRLGLRAKLLQYTESGDLKGFLRLYDL